MTGLRAMVIAIAAATVAVTVASGRDGVARQQPAKPTFTSHADAVQVDVLASHRGRPIPGLTAVDFDLFDSGVRQRVEAVALEELPLHLLLLLDTSTSVAGEPLAHLKEAAHTAIAGMRPADRVALMIFSHALQLVFPWSANARAMDGAIDRVNAEGATALYDALSAAFAMREAVEGRMLILLFTDGMDTTSWLSGPAIIDQARRSDVVIDAVRFQPKEGPGPPLRGPSRSGASRYPPALAAQRRRWFLEEPSLMWAEFLPALADETGGEVLVAHESGDLRAAFTKIIASFRTRYVLVYSPRDVPPSGWHPIDVRLKNHRGEVRARRGYLR
jgi:Ca-activated chloride channel homolog